MDPVLHSLVILVVTRFISEAMRSLSLKLFAALTLQVMHYIEYQNDPLLDLNNLFLIFFFFNEVESITFAISVPSDDIIHYI